MRVMRARLKEADEAKRLDYKYAMERLFLGAAQTYCEAIEKLWGELCVPDLRSRGLRAFREYLGEYIESPSFRALAAEARKVNSDLSAITYGLLLRDGSVTVCRYGAEADYSAAVENLFEKFRDGATNRYRLDARDGGGMNHIEAQIQDRVALLYPDTFHSLDAFCAAYAAYLDEKIARFDREIQFYIAYLTYMEKFHEAGLTFCRPQVSQRSKEIGAQNTFDVALAGKLIGEKGSAVPLGGHLKSGQ
jgi:DNA mismatch repair protein MutS